MKSVNYIIVGSKNKSEKKAIDLVNDFLSDGNKSTIILKPVDGKYTIEDINNLQIEVSKTVWEGTKKSYIITQANKLTVSQQNKMLKLLEESTGEMIQIFSTDNINSILPTIISRCIVINCPPDSKKEIIESLKKSQVKLSEEQLDVLSDISLDYEEAYKLYEEELEFLDFLLNLKKSLKSSDTKGYIYFSTNIKNLNNNYSYVLRFLETFYLEKKDFEKVKKIMNVNKNLFTNADKKMQIESIWL